ncbi:MAG: hypothetical protein EBV86_14825 [Marivivens sp.]|nr:hypothetical protein [Marivivens sp.]NCW69802.1 hypothetical protein [Marivivens sp.]
MAALDMSAIQRYRKRGSDSAVNRVVAFLPRPNRTIIKDMARIIGPAIRDGITVLIKRASEIEIVINRLVVVGLVRVGPAGCCTEERTDCQACSLTAEVAVLIDKVFARHNLHSLISD